MGTYIGRRYKLRAGSPMPINRPGEFVLHTFMAATSEVIIESCTPNLPRTEEFSGHGGRLQSASYSRLPVSANGQELFRGQSTEKDLYGDEDSWGFNRN